MEITIPLPTQQNDVRGFAQLLTADEPGAKTSESAVIMVHVPRSSPDVTPQDLIELLSSLLEELTSAVSEATQ